jgi:hypothetical protein
MLQLAMLALQVLSQQLQKFQLTTVYQSCGSHYFIMAFSFLAFAKVVFKRGKTLLKFLLYDFA